MLPIKHDEGCTYAVHLASGFVLSPCTCKPIQEFHVWSEGWLATGGYGHAQYLGKFEAATFVEAVCKAVTANNWDRNYFNLEQLTYWGCRFFDNEADARKGYG